MKILKNITFKNFTSLSFNHGIHILIQVILVPLFLTFWNLETYADWILISTIPALLAVSQFGLFTYGLTGYRGSGDKPLFFVKPLNQIFIKSVKRNTYFFLKCINVTF